jgi:glycerol kinase
MHTGKECCYSSSGLVSTIAASRKGEQVNYALEGSVFVGGAVIQWLRDELGLIREASDTEYFAKKVKDTAGVYLVPAFTGLGAPYWDMYARGVMVGLTRGANRNHIIRAALESIAFQSNAVIKAMERDTGRRIQELKVDGGASANNFLMQFQSNVTGAEIVRPKTVETTALGAALLAGLATGIWNSTDEIKDAWSLDARFVPEISDGERETLCKNFDRAVERAKGWEE